MSSSLKAGTSVIPVGKNTILETTKTLGELKLFTIKSRVEESLPGLLTTTHVTETQQNETIDKLWPVQKSFGQVEIRGHKSTGLYIFDKRTQTITGSPVLDVLDVANDEHGNTYVFVYGNVLGGQNDDRYAWVSTKDGSLLPKSINDEPVRRLPDGFVALAA